MKIILLHGALGAGTVLEPLKEHLEKLSYEAVILEFPGHGNTLLKNCAFTIEGFASFLDDEIEKKELWGLPVFAFSMGGYILLHLLAEKKRSVGKIITLGTKFEWSMEAAEKETKRLNPDKVLEKVPQFAELLSKRHYDWRQNMNDTRHMMQKLGENLLLRKDKFERIGNEVLILRGEADLMVTKEESEKTANELPNGKYEELVGVPHPLEKVPAEQLAMRINQFLKS